MMCGISVLFNFVFKQRICSVKFASLSILYTVQWDAVDLLTIIGQGTTWYKSMSLMEEIENRKKSCYTGYFQVSHISEKIKIQFPVH